MTVIYCSDLQTCLHSCTHFTFPDQTALQDLLDNLLELQQLLLRKNRDTRSVLEKGGNDSDSDSGSEREKGSEDEEIPSDSEEEEESNGDASHAINSSRDAADESEEGTEGKKTERLTRKRKRNDDWVR